jgi:pimeloyl-ACP methyl ester carboxylesterase
VFLAGDRFNAATCLPLLAALAARFRVVAPDVPGQPGLSADHTAPAPTLGWYGAWLNAVVAQTRSRSCLLVGHSFGGAITLACDSPLARGRLAVSTGGLCRLRLTPSTLADFAVWTVVPRPATSRRLLGRLMGPGRTPRPELVDWMTLVARHTRPVSASEIIAPSNIPTIIATGQADVFLPPARLGPAARAAGGHDLHVIAGAGHLVTEEQPEAVVALLDQLD